MNIKNDNDRRPVQAKSYIVLKNDEIIAVYSQADDDWIGAKHTHLHLNLRTIQGAWLHGSL